MTAGDFYWGDPTAIRIGHPWILLNTPGEFAVLINLTDREGRDCAYFSPSFHPSLTKDSIANYAQMLVWEAEVLKDAIAEGVLEIRPPPLTPSKLARLTNQALMLGFVSREIKRLLR